MEAKTPSKNNALYYIALICAIWFLLTCCAWTYLANVVVSFPFGLIAFLIMMKRRKLEENKQRYRIVAWILIAGIILSCATLVYFLIFE